MSEFTDEDYDRAVGLLWTNSFACKDSNGQAIFPVFSIISHSCLPNSNPVLLQKNQLALEAKHNIAKGDEISISYISIIQVSLNLKFILDLMLSKKYLVGLTFRYVCLFPTKRKIKKEKDILFGLLFLSFMDYLLFWYDFAILNYFTKRQIFPYTKGLCLEKWLDISHSDIHI